MTTRINPEPVEKTQLLTSEGMTFTLRFYSRYFSSKDDFPLEMTAIAMNEQGSVVHEGKGRCDLSLFGMDSVAVFKERFRNETKRIVKMALHNE